MPVRIRNKIKITKIYVNTRKKSKDNEEEKIESKYKNIIVKAKINTQTIIKRSFGG